MSKRNITIFCIIGRNCVTHSLFDLKPQVSYYLKGKGICLEGRLLNWNVEEELIYLWITNLEAGQQVEVSYSKNQQGKDMHDNPSNMTIKKKNYSLFCCLWLLESLAGGHT